MNEIDKILNQLHADLIFCKVIEAKTGKKLTEIWADPYGSDSETFLLASESTLSEAVDAVEKMILIKHETIFPILANKENDYS